ncbi:MAG: ABC transporter ATP-binding protein [Alphaproteobacteria bacterium]|nr:ABC transporter ATP-binding protein [Alphaproteobacteria bacterium]
MIAVDNVHVTFRLQGADITALDGVSLSIEPGQVFVLLGPSGCGKTTLLRCLAGLETPASGKISIDGQSMSDAAAQIFVPPHQRPLAMVFQSYAMWPHMNVFENIAFPLRAGSHKIPAGEIERRVDETLALLEISALKNRPVTTLSGGQQQRVSLARALALRPRVLLMDEPLSNLDHQLQIQLRSQLRALMRRLKLTTVHVTHNQEEALELGDRIAVLNHGKVVQIADGPTLFTEPANSFVARFLGDMNLFAGAIVGSGLVQATVETRAGRLEARRGAATDLGAGAWCYFGIRPNDVRLNATEPGNTVTAMVTARRYLGATVLHTLEAGPLQFQAATHPAQSIEVGQRTRAHFPIERSVVVPAADEKPYEDD